MKDLLLIAQKAIGILRLYWFTLAPVSQKKWKRSEVDTKYTVGLCYSWVTLSLGNPSSLSDSPGKPTQALPWRKTLSLLYWREISLFCISTGDIISISQNCLLDEHPQKDALKLSVSLQKYKRPLEKFLSAISTSHFYTVWTSG